MSGRGGGWRLGLAWALALAGCAPEATTPLLREDFDRLRADLLRVEQTLQKSQAGARTDSQQADRRAAHTLDEIQRGVARVGARLDELGRETGQIQGRLDELRRRVDALALQFDVGGPPPAAGRPGASPRPATPAPSGGGAAPGSSPPPLSTTAGTAGVQASELYQTAYIDYTRGNYNLAIAAFREFLRLYPGIDLAEKAQYWIGECHFSQARALQGRGERDRATQELERAVQEFRRVVIAYPRGDRVPAALYKEALALLELGQPSLAEARFQFLLDQFPSTEEAARARDDLARIRKR